MTKVTQWWKRTRIWGKLRDTCAVLGPVTGPPNQLTFANTSFAKDVAVLFIGTNDLAFNPVSTGTALKSGIETECAKLKAQGKRVIICGVIDRNGGFIGGQTQGNFDLARASYNTLMKADFTVASGITNVYSAGVGITYADYFIDLFADSKFANAADTTYFQADVIHLNSTGYDAMANTYIAPTVLLI